MGGTEGTGTGGAAAMSAMVALSGEADAAWRACNRADAARLSACYRLYRQCVADQDDHSEGAPGYAVIDPFEVCSTRLVGLFAISRGRAGTMTALAVDLTERYPAVLAALAAGRLEQRVAELLARQLRTVDPEVLPRVQQEVVEAYLAAIESGQRPGDGAVRQMADEIIARIDADGLRRRRQDASRERGASIRTGADGMASLWATLAADEAAVLAQALDRRAAEFADPDSPWNTRPAHTDATGPDTPADRADMSRYSPAERRADALMSLILGERPHHNAAGHPATSGSTSATPGPAGPAGSPGSPGSPGAAGAAGAAGPAPLRPRVTVFATGGTGGEPEVQFPRTGQASIAALLAMLRSGDGASIERIDPTIGATDTPDRRLRYRPGAALARTVRLRDGTCRHPGCTVPADYCDLDHLVPFDHSDPATGGHTEECNLGCFCRRHHRFKHSSGWRYTMDPDGTLHVTTPEGHHISTHPSGPLATHRRDLARTEHARWHTQTHWEHHHLRPTGTPPAEPTFWHRRTQRTRTERHANTRHRTRPTPPAPAPAPPPPPPGPGPEHTPRPLPADIPNIAVNYQSRVERQLAELLDRPPF